MFTPLEYGSIGLPEEDAITIFGEDNIEVIINSFVDSKLLVHTQVYHTYFKPLEWTVAGREDNTCYAKLVCNKNDNVCKFPCIHFFDHSFLFIGKNIGPTCSRPQCW